MQLNPVFTKYTVTIPTNATQTDISKYSYQRIVYYNQKRIKLKSLT